MKNFKVILIFCYCLIYACTQIEIKGKTAHQPLTFTDKIKLKTPYINPLETLYDSLGFVNINKLNERIICKLAYSDTSNFLKINLYKGLKHAFLPKEIAEKLIKAQNYLDSLGNYTLIIYDAVRPLHIQKLMWDSLKWPSAKKYGYIAPPNAHSLHNYGCAVDVGIDSAGFELDMGTKFDSFDSLSAPAYEWLFLKNKKLSKTQHTRRTILRKAMHKAQFYGITSEWWHFNYCTLEQAKANFILVK
ncbi:MAG: M15 family metallopeptidase [Bacteroidetes bacterium]|nr:M15 family metallopeptidase [Bacteroidota bacterium]